jgi:hypothetical protein
MILIKTDIAHRVSMSTSVKSAYTTRVDHQMSTLDCFWIPAVAMPLHIIYTEHLIRIKKLAVGQTIPRAIPLCSVWPWTDMEFTRIQKARVRPPSSTPATDILDP